MQIADKMQQPGKIIGALVVRRRRVAKCLLYQHQRQHEQREQQQDNVLVHLKIARSD